MGSHQSLIGSEWEVLLQMLRDLGTGLPSLTLILQVWELLVRRRVFELLSLICYFSLERYVSQYMAWGTLGNTVTDDSTCVSVLVERTLDSIDVISSILRRVLGDTCVSMV